MAMIVRWFSIRRVLFWATSLSFILITFVYFGRQLHREEEMRMAMRMESRKAKIRAKQSPSPIQPPAISPVEASTNKTLNPSDSNNKNEESGVPTGRTLIIPNIPPVGRIPDKWMRPFEMRHVDITNSFSEYKKTGLTMEQYLWARFRIMPLPPSKNKKMPEEIRFDRSFKRHVALFYQYYILAGGKAKRHHGIPSCRSIGLGEQDGEYATESLNQLAGSQGALMFKEIPYGLHQQPPPFPDAINEKGNVVLVTKYFQVNRKGKKKRIGKGKLKKSSSPSSFEENEVQERAKRAAERIFAREFYALSSVQSPFVIQPVCYDKQPRPRMIYPFLKGGDMVPLQNDHLAFFHPLTSSDTKRFINPDESFLPRLFRQLAQGVYAIHRAGIVHLDLKPENLVVAGPDRRFILPFGNPALERYNFIILDFGLAQRLEEVEDKPCVNSGTDVTMAPEQILCNNQAGFGTDWWAVGASMWRTRIFWEPSITEAERSELLRSKCPQFGHYIYPEMPFFSAEFKELMSLLFKPTPEERDFSKSPILLQRLLDSPYLLRGLDQEARTARLNELSKMPPQPPLAQLMESIESQSSRSHSEHHPTTEQENGSYYTNDHEETLEERPAQVMKKLDKTEI